MNARVGMLGQTAIEEVANPSPVLFLHCALFLARNRLVSDETFRLVSFQGQESVSEPFEYQLELHANTDPVQGKPLSFDDVIGRPVTVGIAYPSTPDLAREDASDLFLKAVRGDNVGEDMSLFNGIVTSFSMEIPGVYRLTMKPALWKLTLTNAYAVHKQMNVCDAISKLLDRHRISYSLDAITGSDNSAIARIQDWLQAGETDLEFLRRLMGKSHLYYYFVHTGNGHKMVFANRPETPYPYVFPSRRLLRYTSSGIDELGLSQCDVISQYSYQRSMSSSAVRSVLTRQEAAWEADPVSLFQSYEAASDTDLGELPFNRYKIYQYGCSSDEAQHSNDAVTSAMESASVVFSGSSYCAHFRVGHQFGVTGQDMADMNPMPVRPTLEGQKFVLTQVKHQASADGGYQNEFQATEANGFIASFSIQETQQGVVLAKVVAKAGDPPVQDWRYYTADYFDPETNAIIDNGAANPKLTAMGVYVRFSTDAPDSDPTWVKLAPSMQTVPEIGVTVLVTRAQDESELPEIQTIIQTNGSLTIMPSTWQASTRVGSNYSTNYGDSQGIHFGKNSKADLKQAVNIVSTSYNSGKFRDTGYSQGANYSFSVSESNAGATPNSGELWGPYGGASDLLSAQESFGSSYQRQYANVTSNFSKVGTSYTNTTTDLSENHSMVGVQDNTSMTGMSTSASLTGAVVGSEVTGTSTNISLTGLSNRMQTTGVENTMQTVGMTNQLGMTGMSNNISLTGSSYGISATGETTSISATGMQTAMEAVGVVSRTSLTGVSTSSSMTGVATSSNLTGVTSEESTTGVVSQNNFTGVVVGTVVTGVSTQKNINMLEELIRLNTTETSVTMSNGVTVTAASGRVNTEMSGPDVNLPVIKIIM